MPNGGYDKMDKDGKGGIGILGALLTAAAVYSGKETIKRKKEAEIARKRAELNQQLSNVRYKLSQTRSGLLSPWLYKDEIRQLEAQEAQIIRALNELDNQ